MAQLQRNVKEYVFYQLLSALVEEEGEDGRPQRSQPFYRREVFHDARARRHPRMRKELGIRRAPKHHWSRRMYFVYSMLMGNGVDGLPQTIRVTFELSAFVFLFVRFMTILIFLVPIMEVEVFLGTYSGLTNGQLYRMSPLAFGLSVMNFIFNVLYVPVMMTEVPLLLLASFRFLITPGYLTTCDNVPENIRHFCLDYRTDALLHNDTCAYSFLSLECQKRGRIAYPTQFHFWKDYYDFDRTLRQDHYDAWPLVLVCSISWFVLFSIGLAGMKRIKWFFILSALLYVVILITIILMVLATDGATKGLLELITMKKLPTFEAIGMVVTLTTINLKLISPVGHMTYAAFILVEGGARDEKTGLCFVAELLHLICGAIHIVAVAMIAGVVSKIYGVDNASDMFVPRVGMYYAMVTEFLHYQNVSALFTILYFTSLWTLELSKLAIVVHFHIMNVFDFFPAVFRFETYVRVVWGLLSFLMTLILTYKYCFWFIPTYHIANVYFFEAVRLVALSFVFFYVYGIKRIEDDVLFETGKSVVKFWRILWPVYPLLYITLFISMIYGFMNGGEELDWKVDVPFKDSTIILTTGMGVSAVYLIGSLGFEYLYILSSVGSNISMSNLIKPQFHWGPRDPARRRERKEFAPRIKIRSAHRRARLQRFRPHSIRQMHEQDVAEGVERGRVFLDGDFYTRCDESFRCRPAKAVRVRYPTVDDIFA